MIVAVAFVVFLRYFIQRQGVLGNWIVNFLKRSFHVEHQDAMRIINIPYGIIWKFSYSLQSRFVFHFMQYHTLELMRYILMR
jgi:hypothetical protein